MKKIKSHLKQWIKEGIRPESINDVLCEVANEGRKEKMETEFYRNWKEYRQTLREILAANKKQAFKLVEERLRRFNF